MSMKIQYFVHKYGHIFHSILFLYALFEAGVSMKTPIYWAIIINNLLLMYFVFVHGVSFGIRTTLIEASNKNTK